MTDLIRLAEMVERLAGPDRAVDAAIGQATVSEGWRVDEDGSAFCWVDDPAYGEGWMPNGEVPRYTASLDAAMTLVPEGFKWRCGYSRHVPHNAEVVDYNSHKGTFIGESDSNRACALTAAAIRSIAAQRGQG